MKWKSLFAAVAVSAGMLAGATGLARAETPADQLIVGMSMANILSMDPGQSGSAEADIARANMYDRLIQLDPVTFEIQPQLATEWSVSEDGLVFSFTIREGASFASGNPVSADDVVWSFQRLLLKEMSGGTQLRNFGFSLENATEKVRSPGPMQVELELGEAVDPTLVFNLLAGNSFAIIDSKTAMANEVEADMGGTWLATNSAGSGPFALTRYEPTTIAIFEKNANFWGDAPKLNRIVFRHMPESQTQRLSLERGDIDMGINLSGADLDALSQNPDVKIDYVADGGFYFWAVSEEHEKFRDRRVREAIRHLVDYEGLANTVLKHYGTKWVGPLAPNLQPQIPEEQWALDPERAKALLAEAGYPNGFDVTLRVLSDTPFIDIATEVQGTLALGGINAEIISGGGAVVYDKMRERDFEMSIGRGGSTSPHPYAMATILYNPNNTLEAKLFSNHSWRTSSQNPEINALLEQARVERDPAKRDALYIEVQEKFYENVAAWQPLSAVVNPFAMRADLQVVMHPTRVTRLIDAVKTR